MEFPEDTVPGKNLLLRADINNSIIIVYGIINFAVGPMEIVTGRSAL